MSSSAVAGIKFFSVLQCRIKDDFYGDNQKINSEPLTNF